jgi:hypothetical protein
MDRQIEIAVDASSWPHGRAPTAQLLALSGIRQFNVFDILCHIAFRTRPPIQLGFDLADYWPWLRYAPALHGDMFLRLRPEWTDLDSHQKTILSDDFGVGVSSYFLTEALQLSSMVNTQYFIEAYPQLAALGPAGGKRGPRKSPDYIGVDGNGYYHVIECKGTQSDHATQGQQLATGVPQKKNVSFTNVQTGEALVAGVFVPQAFSQERAKLKIVDPELEEGQVKVTASRDELVHALTEIEIASSLNLAGMPAVGTFALKREQRPSGPNDYIDVETRGRDRSPDGEETIGTRARVFFNPSGESGAATDDRLAIEVTVSMPARTVDQVKSERVSESVVAETRKSNWRYTTIGQDRLVIAPTGLRFAFRVY